MSKEQDAARLPAIGEVWHSGTHGDGRCVRWRCTAINDPTNFSPRVYVMRALRHGTEAIDATIAPKGLPESDFHPDRSDWHGPEGIETEDGESPDLFDALLRRVLGDILGKRTAPTHIKPILIPRGVDGMAASLFLADVADFWTKRMGAVGLESTAEEWAEMTTTLADGRIPYTAAEISSIEQHARDEAEADTIEKAIRQADDLVKAASVEAYANGLASGISQGDSAGYDRGREIGKLEGRKALMDEWRAATEIRIGSNAAETVGRNGWMCGKCGTVNTPEAGECAGCGVWEMFAEAKPVAAREPSHAGLDPEELRNRQGAAFVADDGRDYRPGDIISHGDHGGPLAAYEGYPKPGVAEVRAAVRLLIRYSHGNSLASGWWPQVDQGVPRVGKDTGVGQRNFGELLSLIHSELSEALEGYRKNKDDDHLPHHKNVTVELADALHRIFDLAGAMRMSLAEAYSEKGEFNLIREDHKLENRQKVGGKQF